ncbi:MAG: sigma 54-interacting transcriptional regulator [Deltaproteobacteria bacterium]|jgi:Nif-specific regulatory protein|nr:sigma 54-interacting transcriptional regulator [Deltaproteobacteria bacterium]MBT6431655.1 sigma 54-interacting transcriptional regulator [Deltaproteobacteria bacterium]
MSEQIAAKSEHREHRELRELRLLLDIGQILDNSVDLRDVAEPILSAMAEHLNMLRGSISLVNEVDQSVVIEAAYGLSSTQLKRGVYDIGEGVTGKVVKSGKAVLVPKVSEEPLFLNKTGARKDITKGDVSFICVPIKWGVRTIGALSADHLFAEGVSLHEDVRLMQTIATMLAQALRKRQRDQQERQRLLEENARLQDALKNKFRPSNIIGNSKPMRQVYDEISKVCKAEATVLIRGESGVGKELVAQAVHYNSDRASRPFVKVNCAALSPTLLESELFGHEQGSFTGATRQRIGRFEAANSGTIFLDEIGDFPMSTQVMLLRFLQEKEFERVGGSKTIKADVRIIAATNRNLEELIANGEFREDLYYRLNVFPIYVPPLRERLTDISLLADFFSERYAKVCNKTISRISTPAIDMLTSYHWPGNVRELENSIERAVLLSDDGVIHGHHLPPTLQTAEATGTQNPRTLQEALDNVEREMLVESLKLHRGNMRKAAKDLGITERIMGLRVRKHRINARRFRSGAPDAEYLIN